MTKNVSLLERETLSLCKQPPVFVRRGAGSLHNKLWSINRVLSFSSRRFSSLGASHLRFHKTGGYSSKAGCGGCVWVSNWGNVAKRDIIYRRSDRRQKWACKSMSPGKMQIFGPYLNVILKFFPPHSLYVQHPVRFRHELIDKSSEFPWQWNSIRHFLSVMA